MVQTSAQINAKPINFSWFFLGDGHLQVRIRDGIQFIPIFTLTQVRSKINLGLFNIIQLYLSSLNISSIIREE